ncbi:MAG TPA: hypothetical protein VMV91_01740 [Rhodocyclaceae bacterium]|nr:hypothetical protein [Rhodocyclaceae bacterium]
MSTATPPGLRAARHEFQRGLLKWLRRDPAGAIQMRRAVAVVADQRADEGTLWPLALAWLETLAAGGVTSDDGSFRLCARIDAQLRALLQASDAGAEELRRDLLRRLGERPPTGATILSATLYDLYLSEARGHLAALEREPTPDRTPPMIAAARALGEISATVGMAPIERLARALARALTRLSGAAPDEATRALLETAVERLRTMTAAAAAGRQVEDPTPLAAELDRLGT